MPKLLLADDSITIQKVVELVLADEGFEIKATSNGADALSTLPSFMPDVILADIEMPKMNGYQLCEKVKSDPATSHIPVILLAGAFEPLDEELARKVGANDFLIKPFESEDLISKVRGALAGGAEAAVAPVAGEVAEMEAEAVAEEDLWGVEEIAETAQAEEAVAAEEAPTLGFEETELAATVEEEVEAVEEAFAIEEAPAIPQAAVGVPEISKETVIEAVRRAADERLKEALSDMGLKEALNSALTGSIEKILWEIAPDAIEKIARQALEGAMATLRKDIEKVIWDTVPDLAESIVKKEIEKIKAGI